MASTVDGGVTEEIEARRLREEQAAALAASMRVGLTQEQFERLLKAIEGRGGLLSDLHKLTPEQQVVVDGYKDLGARMGIRGLEIALPRVERAGRVVAVSPPPRTVSARVFLESGVVTVGVEAGVGRIWLPDCISDRDRIARIEFLDERDAVIGMTGGEKEKEGSGSCSTY
jgi:hypothetical protein